ncbi:MAG: ABC transporter ATP-binding protein [Deltaproteobacteria bacterium]|nr:ABC transporter ATP-binding protein [Deltaproteobacteria bacterium]
MSSSSIADASGELPADGNIADKVLLEVRDLCIDVLKDEKRTSVVEKLSFVVEKGRTLGVVGESGCGKSVTAMSILKLLPAPPFFPVEGSVQLEGRDLLSLDAKKMRAIRGNRISMVFQEPMTSLNPLFSVGMQVMEGLQLHRQLTKKDALDRAEALLDEVGIPDARARLDAYPHELSGGMRQRVMIAIALACDPELLIADEPTTALDVTIQAQIMDLLDELQEKNGMSILLITHDLGLVAEACDDVLVMYAGTVVEQAPVDAIFDSPKHPYTQGLLKAIPGSSSSEQEPDATKRKRLFTIEGNVPSPGKLPTGCRFQDRCPHAQDVCRQQEPELKVREPRHAVRCHLEVAS